MKWDHKWDGGRWDEMFDDGKWDWDQMVRWDQPTNHTSSHFINLK